MAFYITNHYIRLKNMTVSTTAHNTGTLGVTNKPIMLSVIFHNVVAPF
jgi:hypothetical protein